MPYIDQDTANRITDNGKLPSTPGELTYVLTETCAAYLNRGDISYADFAVVLGCLESTKLELYRRPIAQYELGKLDSNGDTRQLSRLIDKIRIKLGRSTT